MNVSDNLNSIGIPKRGVFGHRVHYKPMDYPELFEVYQKQMSMFWLHTEVNMERDRSQFYRELTQDERDIIINTLLFFTQMEMDIGDIYVKLTTIFSLYEIKSLLTAIAFVETVHAAAYSYLVDQIQLSEEIYQEFTKYKVLCKKHENLENLKIDSLKEVLKTMAYTSVFTEGIVLFASFCILVSLSRENLLKGKAQIIQWAARDETLHSNIAAYLYNKIIEEQHISPEDVVEVKKEIYEEYKKVLALEIEFLHMVFADGKKKLRNLSLENVVSYIKRLGEMKLELLNIPLIDEDLRYDPAFYPKEIDEILSLKESFCFFTIKGTEYRKFTITDMFHDGKKPS